MACDLVQGTLSSEKPSHSRASYYALTSISINLHFRCQYQYSTASSRLSSVSKPTDVSSSWETRRAERENASPTHELAARVREKLISGPCFAESGVVSDIGSSLPLSSACSARSLCIATQKERLRCAIPRLEATGRSCTRASNALFVDETTRYPISSTSSPTSRVQQTIPPTCRPRNLSPSYTSSLRAR